MKPLKVVWICHFSDAEIQALLKPKAPVKESALWISMLIKAFEGKDDLELFIVSPHKYISGRRQFTRNGIKYYFFNAFVPFIGRPWPSFMRLDVLTDFWWNKRVIRKLVDEIKPDLIHLHGFENAYYSSSVFSLKKKYPVFITVQGFVSDFPKIEGMAVRKRYRVEQKILAEFHDFGIRTQTMGENVLKYNPHARLHWHKYNIIIQPRTASEKLYDIVFFARVSVGKGIEDLLMALVKLKREQNRDYRLAVIGSVNEGYLAKLKEIALQNDIAHNICWLGFQESQEDVHDKVIQAKICVLPTKNDIIPGTIVESMVLGLPVISYDVGSIAELNDKEDCVILVPLNDVDGLAREIDGLLMDPEKQALMAEKGKKRADELLDNASVYPSLLDCYHKTIENFEVERTKC